MPPPGRALGKSRPVMRSAASERGPAGRPRSAGAGHGYARPHGSGPPASDKGRSNAMDTMEILTALGTPAGRADPYPLYAALHDVGEVIELGPGDVLVVGYDAINSVLCDPGFRVSDESSFDKDFRHRHLSRKYCASIRPSSSPAASGTTRRWAACRYPREPGWSRSWGGEQGSAPIHRTSQVRSHASRRRGPQLRRRRALLHRRRAGQAGVRSSFPPGCSTGSRRSPPRANRPAGTGFSCAASTRSQ